MSTVADLAPTGTPPFSRCSPAKWRACRPCTRSAWASWPARMPSSCTARCSPARTTRRPARCSPVMARSATRSTACATARPDSTARPVSICRLELYQYVAARSRLQLPTPPPCPRPRPSVNCHITIEGRQVQLTLRDTDETRLLQRLKAAGSSTPCLRSPQPALARGARQGLVR